MNATAKLSPEFNKKPDNVHHIHLIGICGAGMAAMAGMLKSTGYRVTGSDQHVYPPMSAFLEELHIQVMEGYAAQNLDLEPDLVIVGNVVRPDNEEAIGLGERGLPYLSMPQALGELFLDGHKPLVVTGTHGKTTTSSLLATTLHRLDATPGFMIGGIVEAFQRNFNVDQISDHRFFVVEGDEYDTAFFNKVSKFLHYRPQHAIITSIEFDHADIFPDLEAIKASFAEFISKMPEDGLLVAHGDDPAVHQLTRAARCRVISYGLGKQCSWRPIEMEVDGLSASFALQHKEKISGRFSLPMPGEHNVLNATSVIVLLHYLGFNFDDIASGLASFEGVKRRQQIRGVEAGVTVIDDFAHHPTAVRETVRALRQAWPESRIIVVFEPRTNTSRRAVFQKKYVNAFDGADRVFVREHVPLDNIALEEQFSSTQLVADMLQAGIKAQHFPDTDAILKKLLAVAKNGDIVAILSNGGFDNIHVRLLELLQNRR
ncbi:MAG: UDP-N-acetylmuramate--L-alanine ligase [Desulfobulbus propionicus]|nr:MAG: UDP-N-acetylmuramate--L-alanine ligase [Desulfobulbus propionicus]